MLIYLPVPSAQCSHWRAACSPPSAGGARTQARRSWYTENGQTAVNTAVKCTFIFFIFFLKENDLYCFCFPILPSKLPFRLPSKLPCNLCSPRRRPGPVDAVPVLLYRVHREQGGGATVGGGGLLVLAKGLKLERKRKIKWY